MNRKQQPKSIQNYDKKKTERNQNISVDENLFIKNMKHKKSVTTL